MATYVYPVPRYKDGRPPKISSAYKTSDRPTHVGVDVMYKRLPQDGGKPGVDLPYFSRNYYMPDGVPVLAYGYGKVTTSSQPSKGGYVVIEHPLGWRTQYMHLADRYVKVGDIVQAGQKIGTVGADPNYPLNHLHFQLRHQGTLVDPEPYLARAPILDWPSSVGGWILAAASVVGGYWLYKRYS